MKKEIADKWIAALRSGEYKQGRRALNKKNEYCCLGVLCELAAKEGIVETNIDEEGYKFYDHEVSILPPAVQKWADIRTKSCFYKDDFTLISLNDEVKLSFNQIAEMIEIYWSDL